MITSDIYQHIAVLRVTVRLFTILFIIYRFIKMHRSLEVRHCHAEIGYGLCHSKRFILNRLKALIDSILPLCIIQSHRFNAFTHITSTYSISSLRLCPVFYIYIYISTISTTHGIQENRSDTMFFYIRQQSILLRLVFWFSSFGFGRSTSSIRCLIYVKAVDIIWYHLRPLIS